MEELNKNISGIRALMKDMKTEMYAIVNPDLAALDEYIKNLYLKVLCTIIQYENEPSEMQVLYLKRIVKGIGAEETLDEYMRKALDISKVDIQEFISFMKENLAKYYFTLESMLLVAMGNPKRQNIEYLAELIELCGIDKIDLEYLAMVAKSVLQQKSTYYEESKKFVNDNTIALNFEPYIYNYYVGAVVDNCFEIYYSAPYNITEKEISMKSNYDEKLVTFSNVELHFNETINFNGCEKVMFINCKLYGGNHRIVFNNVGTVIFEGCTVCDFTDKVAECHSSNRFVVKKCIFNKCYYSCEYGDERGGVFSVHDFDYQGMEEITLDGNELHNCYIEMRRHRYNYGVSGAFIECPEGQIKKMTVKDNKFTGCQCIGNGNYTAALIGNFYTENLTEENNVAIGELTRIFEN